MEKENSIEDKVKIIPAMATTTPRRRKAPRYKDRFDSRSRNTRKPLPAHPDREYKESDNEKETLRIMPLGGLGEVGRNMCLLEYKNDILIIDVGFGFPEEDMPGIDYVLPNTAYLDGKQDRILGIIITHGHMDHIGGTPYLMNQLGNPPIYTAELTRGMIIRRQMEFPELPELDINLVKDRDVIRLGEN